MRSVNREARCGYRGQRVGEASHPGGRVERVSKVGYTIDHGGQRRQQATLHDRTPGPEVFSLSTSRWRLNQGCGRGDTVSFGEL